MKLQKFEIGDLVEFDKVGTVEHPAFSKKGTKLFAKYDTQTSFLNKLEGTMGIVMDAIPQDKLFDLKKLRGLELTLYKMGGWNAYWVFLTEFQIFELVFQHEIKEEI
jgi:hypothetical protein